MDTCPFLVPAGPTEMILPSLLLSLCLLLAGSSAAHAVQP